MTREEQDFDWSDELEIEAVIHQVYVLLPFLGWHLSKHRSAINMVSKYYTIVNKSVRAPVIHHL